MKYGANFKASDDVNSRIFLHQARVWTQVVPSSHAEKKLTAQTRAFESTKGSVVWLLAL